MIFKHCEKATIIRFFKIFVSLTIDQSSNTLISQKIKIFAIYCNFLRNFQETSLILSKAFEAKINDVCLFKSLKPHFRQQEFFDRSKKMKKESYSQIPLVILVVCSSADANIATNQNVKERGGISHA